MLDGNKIHNTEEQIDYTNDLTKKYKPIYLWVREEDFESLAIIAKKSRMFGYVWWWLVINVRWIKDLKFNACSGAILKVNQTGSLYDAIKFADECTKITTKF
jgi:enolase